MCLVDEAEGADRLLVLHQGRLVSEGTAAQLMAKTGKVTLADAFIELTGRSAEGR